MGALSTALRGLLGALCLGAAGSAAAGEVRIEMALAADGLLEVHYSFPPGVRELRFVDRGAGHEVFRQPHLRAADACSELQARSLRLTDQPGCSGAHFRVQPVLLARPRTYEAAQPFDGGRSLVANLAFYFAAAPGHGLRWVLQPPAEGYVVQAGGLSRAAVENLLSPEAVAAALADSASTAARDGNQYVVLGRAPVEPSGPLILVLDPAVPADRVAVLRAALQRTVALYTQAYGSGPGGPAAVVVTSAPVRGFHGDTTRGRMMRLRLPQGGEGRIDDMGLARFVAHEAAHWWNAGVYNTDFSRPWLHEGHADWAALLALREAGLMDRVRLQEEIEFAFNRCVRSADKATAAEALRSGPYACGMTMMVLAQAGRRAHGEEPVSASPLATLAGLHRGAPRMDEARFSVWAGAEAASLLNDTTPGFAERATARLQALGLARGLPIEDAGQATVGDELRQALAGSLMQAVMRSDCKGDVDFLLLPGRIQLGSKARCAHLSHGAEITKIQGQPLFDEPVATWLAARQACTQGRPLDVGGTEVPCPSPWPAWPQATLWLATPDTLARLGL